MEPEDVPAALERLAAELSTVSAELEALRAAIATEVRSRRIVVVEEDGFERVVLESRDRFGTVSVRTRSTSGTTSADLFGGDAIDADGAHVGITLTTAGDAVAALEVLEGRPPVLWLEGDPVER